MKVLKRQDRIRTRTPEEIRRRYKLQEIEPTVEEVEQLKKLIVVDSSLSTTSTNSVQNRVITQALNTKVNKETDKGLSTNDFTDEYKNNIDTLITNNHTHNNKSILDTINQTLINNWNGAYTNSHTHSNKSVLDSITQASINEWNSKATSNSYNLASYKVSGLTILRSSCIEKNNRVVINFVGTISMAANTTTTIFNLPAAIRPKTTKDFVVFGQSNNTDGYIGYGYVTETGLTQVRFNTAISSYIRFSVVYDLD